MKTEITYGVLFAGIVVVYVLAEHALGLNTTRHDLGQYTRFAGVLVPILGIFLGIKEKRSLQLPEVLTFGQGMRTGFLIALIQTSLTTLWFLAYSNLVNPQFLDTMLEFERASLQSAGTPEGVIVRQISEKRAFFAFPTLQIFQECFGIAYGVFFAGIFTFFLRRRQTMQTSTRVQSDHDFASRTALTISFVLLVGGVVCAQGQSGNDLSTPLPRTQGLGCACRRMGCDCQISPSFRPDYGR